MNRLRSFLLAFLAFGFAGQAYASSVTQAVFYVNGIRVPDASTAAADARALQTLLNSSSTRSGADRRLFSVTAIYNPRGFGDVQIPYCYSTCQDISELYVLKSAEEDYSANFVNILAPHNQSRPIDQASATAVAVYATNLVLGTNTALSSGRVTAARMEPTRRVILELTTRMLNSSGAIFVGHSEGNILLNLAWARAVSIVGGTEMRRRVRVVNLANTSKFAVSGLDLTHSADTALAILRNLPTASGFERSTVLGSGHSDFATAPATFRSLLSTFTPIFNHFLDFYTSPINAAEILVDQGVTFTASRTAFADRFEDLLYAAVASLDVENTLASSSFVENFDGTTFDSSKWNLPNVQGTAIAPSVAGGFAQFAAWQRVNTKDKIVIQGQRIVIEARMAGQGANRDTSINLIDRATGEVISAGDTNYCGWGLYAFSAYTTYGFVESTPLSCVSGVVNGIALGGSTSSFMEYRLTIDGDRLTIERGPTLSNITQTSTRTLGRSIVGNRYYLEIGTASPSYSPGTFDWVRVTTQPSSVQTWDASGQFNLLSNPTPSGMWQYLYDHPTLGLVPMTATTANCSSLTVTCWKANTSAPDLPFIALNDTGATLSVRTISVPAGMLILHPGSENLGGGGHKPTVSWTAPADGTYIVEGAFQILDRIPSGVRVQISSGATSLLDTPLTGFGARLPFLRTLSLTTGQALYFKVDANGTAANDSTGLTVRITKQ